MRWRATWDGIGIDARERDGRRDSSGGMGPKRGETREGVEAVEASTGDASTMSDGKKRRRDDDDDDDDDEEDDDDDDDDETRKRGNVEYVGVRDVDVEVLSREYTQRAEECATQMGANAAEAMSAEERERLTSEVMRYVLFSTHRERGAPVSRQKIGEAMSAIGGAGGRAKRGGSYVVALAQKKFLDIFGFEMVECRRAQSRNKKPAKTVKDAQGGGQVKCYSLRSVLPAQMRRKFVDDPDDAPARGLAIVVAALIQISSGCIREEALFEHLKKLGISAENARHPQFGDVRELLQSLVKRRVFLRERSVYDDPAAGFSFELAEGAETMIGYENIDKFVNEIMRTTVTTVG